MRLQQLKRARIAVYVRAYSMDLNSLEFQILQHAYSKLTQKIRKLEK
jgi:hypothetical protein